MYAIVYLNTAMSVFTPAKISSSQKHRYSLLLRLLILLKNTILRYRLRDIVCRYRRRIKCLNQQQPFVFNRFMAGVQ